MIRTHWIGDRILATADGVCLVESRYLGGDPPPCRHPSTSGLWSDQPGALHAWIVRPGPDLSREQLEVHVRGEATLYRAHRMAIRTPARVEGGQCVLGSWTLTGAAWERYWGAVPVVHLFVGPQDGCSVAYPEQVPFRWQSLDVAMVRQRGAADVALSDMGWRT